MEDEAFERRNGAALASARRVLSRSFLARTLQDSLADLVAHGPASYDLSRPVDVYGGGIVADLESRTAEILGTEAAAWFPTGTMAQQAALRCWAGRTASPVVALHPLAHPETHERDALKVLTGLRVVHPTADPRPPTAAEVLDLDEPFGTLMLELPLREAGFLLPSWEELTATVTAARERDAVVHFDGARLWETTVHFGRSLPEIVALADSVYVSFYKSLGGHSGAALAGTAEFVAETRAWRHRYGGRLFQQWPAALSALVGLDRELPRLPGYVAQARVVAAAMTEGFAGLPWARVHPEVPHTHQFRVLLPYPADVLAEASVRQAEESGVGLFSFWREAAPGLSATEVTVAAEGLDWTHRDVVEAVGGFLALLP
ncbi:threonine aldolase family protein [Actinocorallia longicatena]|uniref:Beta-eliminating lyase-related protein n=1 Tax=Actinocorallia longicatena TaxID=111803 RepID=A0ABP6Q926_9ACTN